jgi:hypothetical protein|tara:strand:- start:1044 stop:1457 length:414 start_codon:yes stop_codon:yes gene_type:complete
MNSCNLLIVRETYTDESVIGKLYLNGEFISYTLELAWNNNQKSISCVPRGVYDCKVRLAKDSASRNYDHLILEDVPNRSYILFHRGNSSKDSKGCILTGMMKGDNVIYQSKTAHTLLMDKIFKEKLDRKIELVIKNR